MGPQLSTWIISIVLGKHQRHFASKEAHLTKNVSLGSAKNGDVLACSQKMLPHTFTHNPAEKEQSQPVPA